MDAGGHGLLAGLGETVRHADGDFLVLAQDHLGHGVAAVVDERVVQAAIARARVQRGVRNLELFEQVDDKIRAAAPRRRRRRDQLADSSRSRIERDDAVSHCGAASPRSTALWTKLGSMIRLRSTVLILSFFSPRIAAASAKCSGLTNGAGCVTSLTKKSYAPLIASSSSESKYFFSTPMVKGLSARMRAMP